MQRDDATRRLSVSVCLPTRNGAAYLGSLLDSLASQTRPLTELVVSDDDSADGTTEIAQRFAANVGLLLTLRRNPTALGAAGNAAACVGAASGDVILPCDQDDVWDERKIEVLLRPLEESDEVIAAFSDSSLIDAAGVPLEGSLWSSLDFDETEQERMRSGQGLQTLLRRNVVASHALAYRRELHDLALPVPDGIHHLDWWLALLATATGRIVPVQDRLVAYRLHSVNAVGLRSRRSVRDRLDTDAVARSGNDAVMLEAMLGRLRERAPESVAAAEPLLMAKLAHSRVRSALPAGRWRRLVPVVGELRSGGYAAHANGWRSAAVDVLASRRAPAPRFVPSGASPPDGSVAAVVVNYNAGSALARCVSSLRGEEVGEIVVVDNGSSDGSLEALDSAEDQLTVLRTGRNLGYGGGINAGANRSAAEFLLVCNPDIVFEAGSVKRMLDRLQSDPSAGLVGPRLLDTDGNERLSTRTFPSLGRSWRQAFLGLLRPSGRRAVEYSQANRSLEMLGEVDWVTGACLMVRTCAFAEVGGFDPEYFMYVEEVDLCWRLRKSGWKILFEQSARVTHVGGVSSRRRPYRMIVAHHRSLWRFTCRQASGWQRAALPLVGAGLIARCALSVLREIISRGARPPI